MSNGGFIYVLLRKIILSLYNKHEATVLIMQFKVSYICNSKLCQSADKAEKPVTRGCSLNKIFVKV